MTEYRFATAQDYPKVIDFINLVFSQAARPHDFADLIPKVYGDGHEEYAPIHAIALEDGEIRGCVAVLPYDMEVAGQKLRVGYLGSVSVHRLSRGAGHMKKLMQMHIDRAKADGIDMLVLNGQRQRYGYFGFYPVGGAFRYSVGHANVRHALSDVDVSPFTFEKLTQGAQSDFAYDLYQQQPVCVLRPKERFAEYLLSFESQGWLIKQQGEPVGYLVSKRDCAAIHELVVKDNSCIHAVLKAWMAAHGLRQLGMAAAPHDTALNRTLSSFAEGYSIGAAEFMLCLNRAGTIRSWMTLKNAVQPLSEGCVKLGIEDQVLEIKVADGAVTVENTASPADIVLTAEQADYLLFSYNRFYAPAVPGIPADWFPLPLYISRPDTF